MKPFVQTWKVIMNQGCYCEWHKNEEIHPQNRSYLGWQKKRGRNTIKLIWFSVNNPLYQDLAILSCIWASVMNPMNTSLPEGIKCCFVYNRTLGENSIVLWLPLDVSDEQANDEDHCEKILYYIPQNASISEKARDVSIADALIEFSGSFDSESSIQVVRSDKYS
mgnify:FL=1